MTRTFGHEARRELGDITESPLRPSPSLPSELQLAGGNDANQASPPLRGLSSGVEGIEPALHIGLEVADVLQPDMEPQGRAARRPFGGSAVSRAVEGND